MLINPQFGLYEHEGKNFEGGEFKMEDKIIGKA